MQCYTLSRSRTHKGAIHMDIREKFVANVQQEVNNHSIYVWSGQGQNLKTFLTISRLEQMETNSANVKRVLNHIFKIYDDINDVTRIFDCSGLVTYHLIKLGVLKYDTTANGLFKWCKPITKKELIRGDLVFKVTDGKAVHVAVYIGDNKLVECVGRDEGVKNTDLTSKFNKYGRMPV